MNIRMMIYVLGQIALTVAATMLIPFILALSYGETNTPLAFGLTIGALAVFGVLSILKKPKNTNINSRAGYALVALAWLFISLFGCLPFYISREIPRFIDCFFETVSGFTTTGATIISNVETMSKSLLFWRSFTHWIGGMGVLVFVIAVLPKGDPSIVHLLKAEVPGPQFGKLVSKLRFTARILYAIYIVLTFLEVILLLCGGVSVFDSFIHAFSTAGTGGFSNYNASVAAFDSVYVDVVISVFMLIFSVNFNLFYLILIGHVSEALRSEELRCLLITFAAATAAICITLTVNNIYDFWSSLRYSSFQVASILSTTGFSTANFDTWPTFAKAILIGLMFIGGSAGSTAGGLKVSRVIILTKSSLASIKRTISPRSVMTIKLDKRPVSAELTASISSYFGLLMMIFAASVLLISISNPADMSLTSNITAVSACINNVGPGLEAVGPMCNYYGYSAFSKAILCADMLLGRLEILPLLLLFYPKTWTK